MRALHDDPPDVAADRPLGRGALLLAAAAVMAAAFLGTLVRSDDPDMFHHLALGREILRSGLPSEEPFLYPLLHERTGPAPYWLGSVVIYLSHLAFGEVGLSLLPAAVGALLAAVLLLDAAPRGARHGLVTLATALLPVALAVETYRYRAVARTEIFSALLLAWTMWAMRRFEDGRPRALLAFPAVAVLWTNLHPGTAVALAPLALLVACGVGQRLVLRATGKLLPGTPSPRHAGVAAGVLLAGLAASALNPSPANPVVTAVRFAAAATGLGRGAATSGDVALSNVAGYVGELRGGGAALWGTPVGVLIALSALALLLRWRTVRVREVLTVAAFAVLPFLAVRFAMFFAVVAAPIAARLAGELATAAPASFRGFPARKAAAAVLAAGAVASAPLGALAPHIGFGAGVLRGAFPVRGADYLQANGFAGRLFNSFALGGYLEWRQVGPPFQDGRGATRAEDAAGALAGPLSPSFAPLDARYRFDALLVAYPGSDPVTAPLASIGIFDPDRSLWALVAFDDAGLLYLRRNGRYGELALRDEFRHARPAVPVLTPPSLPAPTLAEYRRSVGEAPDCFRCRFFLGELELAYGSPEGALGAALPALERLRGPERDAFESLVARARAAAVRPR